MTVWLVEPQAWKAYQAQRRSIVFSADQITAFTNSAETKPEAAMDAPRNLKIAGSTAQIDVQGILTKKPDIFAYYFGGGNTTYSAIQGALAYASNDPSIKHIVMNIDSPGGQVDGLFETLAAIQSVQQSGKTMSVQSSLAASAAYAIAAVAGKITSTSPSGTFGSIGVVSTYYLDDESIDITSTNAPNKRPDPSTDEGRAVIRSYLDELHELFVSAIAVGRDIDPKAINAEFGGGSVFAAKEAKRRGMIDGVSGQLNLVKKTSATTSGKEKENHMDLKTLKAQHPELVEALIKEGATAERDRVTAHLTMGEASGDMKTAIAAIQAGDAMTISLQAKYMAAGMNRRDVSAHAADSAEAAAATAGAAGATPALDIGDQIAEALGAPKLESK